MSEGRANTWPAHKRRKVKSKLLEQQNHRCCVCGNRMDEGTKRFPTFEHIIMRSMGGPMNRANIVLTCNPCNRKGKAQTMWRRFCRVNGLPIDWHISVKEQSRETPNLVFSVPDGTCPTMEQSHGNQAYIQNVYAECVT